MGEAAELSIFIDPELTGLGLGKAMILAGQEWASRVRHRMEAICRPKSCRKTRHRCSAFAATGFRRQGPTWLWEVCTMISIGGRLIGVSVRPYLIAEMSGNHNRSLERALQLVDAAAQSGADAIKLQTYTADTMTLDVDGPGFVISDPNSLWKGRRLHELYEEAHTPWDWHRQIMERAASHGLHCFSTPFDETAVDFLESLDVPAYKIASFEITDLRLIRKVAGTGKPMIISTGMATIAGDR